MLKKSTLYPEGIFEIISTLLKEVVPELEGKIILASDSFRSLGINSIERMEVTMLLLEEIELDIPRIELLKAITFEDLSLIVSDKLNQ